jgi:tripeptide aminopeptidase
MSTLERFCRYVALDTQAVEDSPTYPSSPGQIEFNRLLAEELKGIGCQDVHLDQHGILTATVPGNRKDVPVMAWVAHVDTSPETSGAGVKPQVHPNYDGGDVVLPGDPTKVLRPAEFPALKEVVGHTLITTDGTTLLGADDKCGVTALVEAAERLLRNDSLPRGTIRLVFTCDEEIGAGTRHLSLERIGAQVAYTLDGEGLGSVDSETFSADMVTVKVTGVNTHPCAGKGRMVNAIRILSDFLSRLPQRTMSPETTSGREGFLHPYHVEGSVAEAWAKVLLRDFETEALSEQLALLESVAVALRAEHPQARIDLELRRQYRNMRDGLLHEPRAVAYAVQAMRNCGLTPRRSCIRGGTDGSSLTEMGLPTPNLSSGQHSFHSPYEWTTVEEMDQTVEVLLALAATWAEGPDPGAIEPAPLVTE